jgi:nucleoid-associated protein YgaU
MDQFSKLRAGVFLIALVSLTACSSSKVDDAATNPPETAGAAANAPDAKTDAVPPVGEDPSLAIQSAPGSLDAKDAPQAPDAAAVAAADAPPPDAGDPAAAAAANADPATVSVTSPPMADTPPASDPAMTAGPDLASNNTVPPPPTSDAPATASMNLGNDDSIPPPPSDEHPSHSRSAHVAEASGDGVNYTVKRGDTLMKIAFENYGDLYRWKEIYESNRSQIQDPNHVPPGTQLTLNGAGMVTIERNGNQYLIKHGDTLGLISTKVYQTSKKWKKLWENNRQLIKDPNRIYAGFYLYYHPESRMTQGSDGNDTSAANAPQNLPFKDQPQAPVKAAVNTAAQATAPVPGVRAPASKSAN